MSNTRRWTVRSTFAVIVLSLVGASLVALVVTMSTSRIGAIKLPEHRFTFSYTRNIWFPGGHMQSPCHAANARCRREPSAVREAGSPVPSWELALAGLLTAGVVGVLWKTRRTQQSDVNPARSSLDSPPGTRLVPRSPREAVLAAFADVEDRLTSQGIARETWEAPESYLVRAAPDGPRSESPVGRLARLYALARYSRHPIDSSTATQAESAAAELSASLDPPQEPT